MDPFSKLFFAQGTLTDFDEAYKADTQRLVRLLFYLRDKNYGCGQRALFCSAFVYLACLDPTLYKLLPLIPKYGSWKDLVTIATLDQRSSTAIARIFAAQLQTDLTLMRAGKRISTAAKWFPSARSQAGRLPFAQETRTLLNVNEACMRREFLSPLRNYLQLVETKMSKRQWGEIDYKQVPRVASKRYHQSFWRHNPDYTPVIRAPRTLLETVVAILHGQTLGVEEYWKEAIKPVTATGIAVVCDSSTPTAEYPIGIALAIGRAGIYSFEVVPRLVEFRGNESICLKVGTLKELSVADGFDATSISVIPADCICVVTSKSLPDSVKAVTGKRIIWWQLTPTTSLRQHGDWIIEITGFSQKILACLLKGYIPQLTEIVASTLDKYKDIVI